MPETTEAAVKKLKVQLSKTGSFERRGSGNLTWGQIAAVFRKAGIFLEGQHFETIEADKKGIQFTTSKTGNQK